MTRIFGHYVALEMALLCLVEWVLAFAVIYFALAATAGSDVSALIMHVRSLNFAVVVACTIGVTAITIGLYRPEVCLERRRLVANAAAAAALAFPAVLVVSGSFNINLSEVYLIWLAKVLLGWIVCLMITHWIFSFAMQHRLFVRRVLVLGSGPRAARICEAIQSHRGKFFEVVSASDALADNGVTCHGTQMLAALRAQKIWGIVLVPGGDEAMPAADLLDLKMRGTRVFDELSFWEQHLGRVNLDRIDANWLLFADGFASGWLDKVIKRISDVVFSLALLVLTLPLMVFTALLIKLDSRGPVFYRQERVGLHGKTFTLFKFRSMRVDAEDGGRPRWASQKDPRVTRVGGFIRSTRIDELPQLLNVLHGEMSFIGPRPERPAFVEQLAELIPFYHERSYVKPGITGWAQVNFPYGASVEDARQKQSYDLYYVKNRSLFLDLLILLATVRVIIFQEGAR